MEPELAALAASAATSVVSVMVTETWTQVRDRVVRFLNRGGDARDQEVLEGEVRSSEEELAAARAAGDEQAAADVEAGWRTRMRRALRDDPAAADELRLILRELDAEAGGGTTVNVSNSVSGGVQHAPVLQGQNFSHFQLSDHGARIVTGDAPDARRAHDGR